MKFANVIEEAINLSGSVINLAGDLDIDPSEVTRMRKPGGKISIAVIDKVLNLAGLEIVKAGQDEDMKGALRTVFRLWEAADKDGR